MEKLRFKQNQSIRNELREQQRRQAAEEREADEEVNNDNNEEEDGDSPQERKPVKQQLQPQRQPSIFDSIAQWNPVNKNDVQTFAKKQQAASGSHGMVEVQLNLMKWKPESDYGTVVDTATVEGSFPEFHKSVFLKTDHFRRDVEPIIRLYGQGLRRVAMLPYKVFPHHSHIRGVFMFDKASYVYPEPFTGLGDGIAVFRLKSLPGGPALTAAYFQTIDRRGFVQFAEFEHHTYHVGV